MNKIKKILNSKTLPFITLFFIMLFINIFKSVGYCDDTWFSIITKGEIIPEINSISSYMTWRYETWSSRLIIEFWVIMFTSKFGLIWKVLDAAIYVALAYGIYKVFASNKNDNKMNIRWVIVFLVLLIPSKLLVTAGWIATSLNYLWPLTFGIWCLIPIRNCLESKKIRWYEFLLYIPILLYAANSEQICLVLVTVYIIFSIYFLIKKKINPLIIVMLIVAILSLVYIMTCPGNQVRSDREVGAYFPDFEMLSIVDKLLISFTSTMQYYIFDFNAIYVIFTLLIMTNVYKKYDNIFYKAIATFPFLMGIAFNIGEDITKTIFPTLVEQMSEFNRAGFIIHMGNYNVLAEYIPVIMSILNIGMMLISVYLVFGNTSKTILGILILGAGICTRLLMGFMPSVFVSGHRTQFIFIITMLILTIMMLDNENNSFVKKVQDVLMTFALLAIINSLYLSLIMI